MKSSQLPGPPNETTEKENKLVPRYRRRSVAAGLLQENPAPALSVAIYDFNAIATFDREYFWSVSLRRLADGIKVDIEN